METRMIETLKNLKINDMITLDDELILNTTHREDFKITDKKILQCEDGECVILELDDFHLISHNLGGDEMHLLVQIENILPVNSEVPEEVKISYNNNEIYYQIVSVEWQCGDEIICDYENDDEEMNKVILEKTLENDTIYRGFEISEDAIVI
jgi:hypothetical protein